MPTKKLTPKEIREYEARLQTLLALLSGDIDKLEQEALGERDGVADTTGEGESAGYSQEFSLELLQRDESTLREVVEALDRIKNGSYGQCESCGAPIRKERLNAVPHARYCIECQREEERRAS